ncbi:MAG: chromate transporter [Roseateles sp.]|jgi:chromate transporter|nr:chromate transporter [Methylibium sp.]MBY0368871.1 chromate transporter [Burkholderiaceae bacterium]|mmetsp:Transcript_39182/g.92023  ORF Transcript_39182/g.92023 Transcript_39182/m.92023 type:complete len:181 (-) Transcript_39182:73-615(-)
MTAPVDLASLFLHFLTLSLLSIGGAITTVPEMHRFLVDRMAWLSDSEFTASIALAQAAPGPNILFVAVLGYNVAGLAGAAASMAGILLPSTVLTLTATRWARANREHRAVRAFAAGMTPLTLGLIIATGWLLAQPFLKVEAHRMGTLLLIATTLVLTLKTRLNLVWMVLAGGLLGALGLV